MSFVYSSDEAKGALRNGTRVEKQNSEPKDGHPNGERGEIMGSMGPLDVPILGCRYGYFVMWDGTPGIPVFTMESKVKKCEPPSGEPWDDGHGDSWPPTY